MKLSDFYNQKKYPVTSVNSKVGAVVLGAQDVGAISKKQLGVLVPTLKNGIVPDTQLPDYIKAINGKISSAYIPVASNDSLGGIKLGDGFETLQNGVINSIGCVTRQQVEKLQVIKIDGSGYSVLTDNGTYAQVVSNTQTRIQFDSLNSQNNVIFNGNLPIVCILSENNNYYILQSGDITYTNNTTVLHMHKYLISEGISTISATWVAFVASAIKYIDNEQFIEKYKQIAFNQALIYG